MSKIDRFAIPDNTDQREKAMQGQNVYQRLADHLSNVGMGYPVRETLLEILRENLNPSEAEIALALPTGVIPFHAVSVSDIGARVAMSHEDLESALDRLAEKGFPGTWGRPRPVKKGMPSCMWVSGSPRPSSGRAKTRRTPGKWLCWWRNTLTGKLPQRRMGARASSIDTSL